MRQIYFEKTMTRVIGDNQQSFSLSREREREENDNLHTPLVEMFLSSHTSQHLFDERVLQLHSSMNTMLIQIDIASRCARVGQG